MANEKYEYVRMPREISQIIHTTNIKTRCESLGFTQGYQIIVKDIIRGMSNIYLLACIQRMKQKSTRDERWGWVWQQAIASHVRRTNIKT